jgi:hypothetical protein
MTDVFTALGGSVAVAESFLCQGEWVEMSNGATESLFECWATAASVAGDRPGMAALAAFLRHALDASGPGSRAFGMDRDVFPDELAGAAGVAALLELIDRTVADPSRVPDVTWTPDLVESWAGRLGCMAAAVRAAFGPSPHADRQESPGEITTDDPAHGTTRM